jgi:hypothetical protein
MKFAVYGQEAPRKPRVLLGVYPTYPMANEGQRGFLGEGYRDVFIRSFEDESPVPARVKADGSSY